jgi:hypothetical protein
MNRVAAPPASAQGEPEGMSKEHDYLESATETVRLVQHASTSSDRLRLLRLAEG